MQGEKRLKILILEDNENDVLLIEHVLQRDNLVYEHICVDTRSEFIEAIMSFRPDVVLSDHGLPGFNSREALKLCLKVRPSTPFILVTGTVSDEYAVSCLREGADDYILKSNLSRLPSAIRSAVKRRRLECLKREARHALRTQNAALLKVNRELDSFVYSVSHNLRGPLASVMGLLNIACGMEDVPSQLSALHAMMASSMSRLDNTLKEIIDYSRNARNEVQAECVNWQDILHAAFEQLSYLPLASSAARHFRFDTAVPFYSDISRLSVIFNNVLTNSLLYHDPARPLVLELEIRTSGQEAVITLTDNGIGIRESVLPHVCNMFFRGTEVSQGAGLGLYIVQEIVTRLGGTLRVASVYGNGTTVTVCLPNMEMAYRGAESDLVFNAEH
jgi:signal transduction histidine kinase